MVRIPKWITIAIIPLEFVVALILAPYALSGLSPRYGWTSGRPDWWNLLGALPVVAGAVGIVWSVSHHVAKLPTAVELELTPTYLLKLGPYRFTRNPIYIAVLTMWLGWTIVYGSVANGVVLLLAGAMFAVIVVPFEERRLERRFGDDYLHYKAAVARWFGRGRAARAE
jgi:protein-S-isoprenylcysteine O-methyltransferase Ste14